MYTIPPTLKQEISEYQDLIVDYRAGRVESVKFKSIRVPMGIYEQRANDTYMVRVRCTGGFLTPRQLKEVAGIARKNNAGYIHITTRQELQIQDIELEDTGKILEQLHEIGLSSRGGGGNTVRNIMASFDSGISDCEAFDVLPYATALTDKLTAEPDSWLLPRKFKISFSSSANDNAHAAFNDLGFIARISGGKRGFKVYLGGSLGVRPMTGHVLFEFLPAEDFLYVAEAAKKLFSRYGNRKNRHRARLRFVFYKHGKEKVAELFQEIFREIKLLSIQARAVAYPAFKIDAIKLQPDPASGPDFELWKKRYAGRQGNSNLYSILVPVCKGNLDAERCEALALFLENFGDDTIRFTMRQNIILRNIPVPWLGNIYRFLKDNGFATDKPVILNSMVACTGADTCRLGICHSKSALEKIIAGLEISGLDLDSLKDLNINISGCPNSCGQQSASDLGFYGKVGRTDRIFPAYTIMAGARKGEDGPRLARTVDEISARDLPEFLQEFLQIYISGKSEYNSFADYVDGKGENDIRRICDKFRSIPSFEQDRNYYYDWGSENIFSVSGRGDGQCSAGLFDMIDFDLKKIKKYRNEFIESAKTLNGLLQNGFTVSRKNELLYQIIFSASRMLLITRGFEPKTNNEVFNGFIDKFIGAGLVDEKFREIIAFARDNKNAVLTGFSSSIFELADTVIRLYENMDDSLQFNIPEKGYSGNMPASSILKKDYRSVQCPMNFVKTKIDLASMNKGELLEIWIDDGEPVENVPGSVRSEGHRIIKQTKINDYWSVLIEKN
jgi:sulfite reductase (ferredoxin)